MRKFRHPGKFNEQGANSEPESVSFSGGVIADEIEIDGTTGPSGRLRPGYSVARYPSDASGVIIVGGSMPEVEVDDSPRAVSAGRIASPSEHSNGNGTSHADHNAAHNAAHKKKKSGYTPHIHTQNPSTSTNLVPREKIAASADAR